MTGNLLIVFISLSTHLHGSGSPSLDLRLGSTLITTMPSMVQSLVGFLSNVAMLKCEEIILFCSAKISNLQIVLLSSISLENKAFPMFTRFLFPSVEFYLW